MQVYNLATSAIKSPNASIVESPNSSTLLGYTPTNKILGVVPNEKVLYYFDGSSWRTIIGTSGINGASLPSQVIITATSVGDTQVGLNWNNTTNTSYYKVFVSTSGVSEYLYGTTNNTNIVVSGINNDVSYSIRVVATNTNGDGQSSNTVNLIPHQNAPTQVTNLSVSNINSTSATLTWDVVPGATSYKIYLTISQETFYGSVTNNNSTLVNLNFNTPYSVRIVASNFGGDGPSSSNLMFTTLYPIPDKVINLVATPGLSSVSLSWATSLYTSSYYIYRKIGTSAYTYLNNTSSTYYTDSNLLSGFVYTYYVNAVNQTGISTSSDPISSTISNSTFVEQKYMTEMTSFSGMLLNQEPDEGNISQQGRTYTIKIDPLFHNPTSSVSLYFGNMFGSSATGLKFKVATETGKNAQIFTNNIQTGWISGVCDISGASSYGHSFKSVQINFNATINEEIWIQMYVPPRTSASGYARSYSTCGAAFYQKASVFDSLKNLYKVFNWGYDNKHTYMDWCDGDFVSNNIAFSASHATLDPHDDFPYKPPYVSSLPLLAIKWGLASGSKKRVIEMVGDSIMQGYGDGYGDSILLGVEGISSRLNSRIGSSVSSGSYDFYNFGQSGATPEEYLARWVDWASNTSNSATALCYSIFSPNGYFNNGYVIGNSRNIQLQNCCISAENYAKQFNRVFIPCFITGTNIYLLDTLPASAAGYNGTSNVQNLLDWAKNRYGNRLLDLHSAIQDQTNLLGPSMAAIYTADQTHPNPDGYEALGSYAATIFDQVYLNCLNAS